MSASPRYTAVAIVLHWAIAIAILGMIPLGWWMGEALEDSGAQAQAIAAFQLHKSIGLTVLLLSLTRLGWRFANPPPPMPAGMKGWERTLASATHWAFYAVIIAMPLTGWLYVSTAWSAHDDRPLDVPTLFFGLFQVPHLFGLSHLADSARANLAGALEFTHSKLAWGAIVLAALHVGAALKHHVVDKDDVLTRMVPGLKPLGAAPPPASSSSRVAALIAGFAAIALATAAALWTFAHPPTGAFTAPASAAHSHNEALAPEVSAPETAGAHEHAEAGDDHDHAAAAPAPNSAGPPPTWRVDAGQSTITYAGVHAGVPFQGRFAEWRADIRFDPAKLDQSSAVVTINTGSAADGIPLHDQSLPGAEWFDVAHHPTATFRSTRMRARGDAYEADGVLTIKGRRIDIDLPFTLRIEGDRAIMDGQTRVRRADADLGMESDADGEYVSREIAVSVHVEAARAQ